MTSTDLVSLVLSSVAIACGMLAVIGGVVYVKPVTAGLGVAAIILGVIATYTIVED